MKRVVFLGVVLAMTVAVVGFSMAADKAAKVAPVVDGADSAAAGCPAAGGCCAAKEGCPVAAAGCAAGGCAATGCPAEKGCCAKKKVALVCPVSGDPASKTIFASFNGGKVYLRCNGCKAKFEKDAKKFATKANLQLVSTGQFVQKGCPFSGGKVNKETEISLNDVKVGFCCKGCQGKVAKAKPEEQLEMLFSNKAFKKAYALKKAPAKKKEKAAETKAG
jgi:hypothetical protein